MARSYVDDSRLVSRLGHGQWNVALYWTSGRPSLSGILAAIFLGQAGGSTLSNFARAIGDVHVVRSTRDQA